MRIVNLIGEHSTFLRARRREWLLAHWGMLSDLARRLKRTRQHIRQVFWGLKRSAVVERALHRRGAPLVTRGHETRMRRRRRRVNV